jgi:hypothetical protein
MQDSTEITMAALVVLFAITVTLSGGFVAACWRIRRTDKWGTLRPETPTPQRHHMLAYTSRWDGDDNRPNFA